MRQNQIKVQAHEHPKFRRIAAKYGQTIHQINMRLSVALLRDIAAEKRAKERAEAPTVKTEEQTRAEEAAKEKAGAEKKESKSEPSKSVWRRRFRPLPEAKAVDLFADVIGDAFILAIAGGLIIYEYVKAARKPDITSIKIAELEQELQEEKLRIAELEDTEKQQRKRIEAFEEVLEALKHPDKKQKALLIS